MKTRDTNLLSITFGLIVLSTVSVILALSTLSGLAQSEDNSDLFGYPAPTDDIGYPIYWYGYPDPSYPAPIDYGYPVGYPIYDPYPVIGYPVDIGYPVFEPVPMPDYPEPVASSPELSSNPVQLEPITPQYRNGRNLWQEILFKFSKLLELMK